MPKNGVNPRIRVRGAILRCVAGEHAHRRLTVPIGGIVIGRGPACDLVLSSHEVSGIHLRAWPDRQSKGMWIQDMRSTNGTWWRDTGATEQKWSRLNEPHLLTYGARFRVGTGAAEFEVLPDHGFANRASSRMPRRAPLPAWRRNLALALVGVFAAVVLAVVSVKLATRDWKADGTHPPVVDNPAPKLPPLQPRRPPVPKYPTIPKQPVEIVSVELSNMHGDGSSVDPASEEDMFAERQSKFRHSRIRVLRARVRLKNNNHGVRDYSGKLGAKFIQPDGQIFRNSSSPPGYTLESPVVLPKDSPIVEMPIGWGSDDASAFEDGQWSIEFWWEGRRIGQKTFVVYSPTSGEAR